MQTSNLLPERELGRIAGAADTEAIAMLVGAIHGLVVPRVLFNPPGTAVSRPPGVAERLTQAVISGIALA